MGAGVSTLIPRAGTGRGGCPPGSASWASEHGLPTSTIPRAVQGRAHGGHAAHATGVNPKGAPRRPERPGPQGSHPPRGVLGTQKPHRALFTLPIHG